MSQLDVPTSCLMEWGKRVIGAWKVSLPHSILLDFFVRSGMVYGTFKEH